MKEPTIKDMPLKELAEWSANNDDPRTTCAFCGERMIYGSHSDDYHRFTPLCDLCYHDDGARYATAYKIKDRGYRNSPESEADSSGPPVRH